MASKRWSTVKKGGFKRHAPGIKSRRKHKKNGVIIPIVNGVSKSNKNISFKTLKAKTIKEIEFMKETEFYKQIIMNFNLISSSNYKLLCKISETNDRKEENVSNILKVNIICYGLGNFSKSVSSMKQMSVLCLIIDSLGNDKNNFILNKCELFDPILTSTEKKVLKYFGITVLLNDTNGKYAMNENSNNMITLCFMPHSPLFLYNNLLAANWFNKYVLTKLYIIGNSFEQYHDLQGNKEINWILMTHKLDIIKEIDIHQWIDNNNYVTSNAFAFQKLIYFPIQEIRKYQDTKWTNIYHKLLKQLAIGQ